jgi:hypothetical protein
VVEVGYLQVARSARSVTGTETEMQQPSLGPFGPLGGGQRPLHHAPDTWERAKGGRDAVGRDSLGGFCRRTFACQVDGLSLAVAHDEDRGRIGGRECAAGIVNDGERSCCLFAVCGRWQSNALARSPFFSGGRGIGWPVGGGLEHAES